MTPMTPPQNLSENTMPTSVSGSDFRFARYHGFLNVSMTRLNLVGFRLSKMDPGNNFLGIFESMESKESAGVISFRSHDPVT